MCELRELTFEHLQTPFLELPIVFKGTYEECTKYANNRGFNWKATKRNRLIFGGYFTDTEGNCLLPM